MKTLSQFVIISAALSPVWCATARDLVVNTNAGIAGSSARINSADTGQRADSIRGMVKDENDSPLADVKVQMCGLEKLHNGMWRRELRLGDMPWYFTDKQGRFSVPIRDPELRYDFYVDKAGFAPTFLYGITNHSPELTVVLKRGITVTGTVSRLVDGKAEPVVGTKVELRLPYVDLWYQRHALTDANGRYTFQVTPSSPDRKWQVVYAGEVVQLDVRKEGQPVKGPDFKVSVAVDKVPGDIRELKLGQPPGFGEAGDVKR